MKNTILFIIMFMCMISLSAFAVDYSHDKSPPGIEVYDGIQSDVIAMNDIKIQEAMGIYPALVIQAIDHNMELVELAEITTENALNLFKLS